MKNKKYFSRLFISAMIGFSLSLTSFIAYGNNRDVAQSATQTMNDAAITTAIKAKYIRNPILNVFDIGIETNNGVAKLSGLVDSDTQYQRAIILAENTDGVKNVDSSNLKTKSSPQPLKDSVITAKVKGLLLKDKLVNDETEANPWPIHVETKDGVVFISGTVANNDQKNQVIKIAKLVDGVKSVKADLRFKS